MPRPRRTARPLPPKRPAGPTRKWYAVCVGRNPGVYRTWEEAKAQVHKFPGASSKGFPTRYEAENWFLSGGKTTTNVLVGLDGGCGKSTLGFGKRCWEGGVKQTDSSAGKVSHPGCAGTGLDTTSPHFREPGRLPAIPWVDGGYSNTEGDGAGGQLKMRPEDIRDFGCAGAGDRKILKPSAPSKRDNSSSHSNSNIILKASNSTPESPFQSVIERVHPSTPDLLDIVSDFKHDKVDIMRPKKPSVQLTPEQNRVLQLVLDGRNVFFTGPAGSGKSLILEHIKYHLSMQNKRFAITAPTGISAAQLGGSTIHSWSGVGLGEKGLHQYIGMATARHTIIGREKEKWINTEVLIIDEISMLNADLWEKLNGIAKAIRYYPKDSFNTPEEQPFGGIQMVVCGDFFQLPPVTDRNDSRDCQICGTNLPIKFVRQCLPEPPRGAYTTIGIDTKRWSVCVKCGHPYNEGLKYVFQTSTWNEASFGCVVLTKVHRQEDQNWVDMLTKIKLGNADEKVLSFLQSLRRPLPVIGGVIPTKLYTHRNNVIEENNTEFAKLSGQIYTFKARDTGWIEGDVNPTGLIYNSELENMPYFRDLQTSKLLRLKDRAQVMLLANIDTSRGLVNGSRGIVCGFAEYTRKDLLEAASSFGADKAIAEKYFEDNHIRKFREKSTLVLPQVRFVSLRPSKDSEAEIPPYTVFPCRWDKRTTLSNKNHQVLERIQIPLALAWVATIHKAQGMTLDLAAVDIERSFLPGQAYVGLSRCRSPDGLQILGLGGREALRKAIMCCAIVRRFDAILQRKWEWSAKTSQEKIPEYDDSEHEEDDIKQERNEIKQEEACDIKREEIHDIKREEQEEEHNIKQEEHDIKQEEQDIKQEEQDIKQEEVGEEGHDMVEPVPKRQRVGEHDIKLEEEEHAYDVKQEEVVVKEGEEVHGPMQELEQDIKWEEMHDIEEKDIYEFEQDDEWWRQVMMESS